MRIMEYCLDALIICVCLSLSVLSNDVSSVSADTSHADLGDQPVANCYSDEAFWRTFGDGFVQVNLTVNSTNYAGFVAAMIPPPDRVLGRRRRFGKFYTQKDMYNVQFIC